MICYADSKSIVDIVYGKHSNHFNPRINAPLTTIRQMLQLPWVVKIEHAVKEINEPADKLSRKGYGLEKQEIVTFDRPLLELQHLLKADAARNPVSRNHICTKGIGKEKKQETYTASKNIFVGAS